MGSFKSITLVLLVLAFPLYNSFSQTGGKAEASAETADTAALAVRLVRHDTERRVDIIVGGKHFTSYVYTENLKKPVLYPIKTADGALVTRGFPLKNRPFERTDHPHHIGLWLNYGDVNGLDFWNNSEIVPEDKKDRYGTVVHRDIALMEDGDVYGQLAVTADWIDSKGNLLLREQTRYIFRGSANSRHIDRITNLSAPHQNVFLKDNKEGMLGLRVARELEHPSNKAEMYTDAQGRATDVKTVNKEGVNGYYHGSNGIRGEAVWGTRAEWMALTGEIQGEPITVAIFDHTGNVGYPTYWHARGYGLFAANPLGQKAMSGGNTELNFSLKRGESVTFRHRIVVYSGNDVTQKKIDADHKSFVATNE